MDELDRVVEVAGAPIRYSVTGQGSTTIALTHGFRAHHLWWAAVEPLLSAKYQIVQLDISGSGDSGHREQYTIQTWGQEVNAVLDDAGIDRALLVGHSLGGTSVVMAATQRPERAIGVILMDTFIEGEGRFRPIAQAGSAPVRIYASREDGEGRFRLMPTQDDVDPAIIARIASYGVKQIDEGWTWKFDPNLFPRLERSTLRQLVGREPGPVFHIHGDRSRVMMHTGGRPSLLTAKAKNIAIPDSAHHIMIDQPLALVAALRATLAHWP